MGRVLHLDITHMGMHNNFRETYCLQWGKYSKNHFKVKGISYNLDSRCHVNNEKVIYNLGKKF